MVRQGVDFGFVYVPQGRVGAAGVAVEGAVAGQGFAAVARAEYRQSVAVGEGHVQQPADPRLQVLRHGRPFRQPRPGVGGGRRQQVRQQAAGGFDGYDGTGDAQPVGGFDGVGQGFVGGAGGGIGGRKYPRGAKGIDRQRRHDGGVDAAGQRHEGTRETTGVDEVAYGGNEQRPECVGSAGGEGFHGRERAEDRGRRGIRCWRRTGRRRRRPGRVRRCPGL